jgi:hypothetical protein
VTVGSAVDAALERTGGLLHLAPCWVPRAFLQPGRRLRLHPDDLYAFGLHRGGIDERWMSSTVEAANDGREPDEGLSYVVSGDDRFLLRDAVADRGSELIGERLWRTYGKWPVFAKFFDNMGSIPHHMHQDFDQAAHVGCEGKPESYYFPPQYNPTPNTFPYTWFGLNPGTTKEDLKRCLERWSAGDNGILDLSRAYRLELGTGWLVDPRVLHGPGSLCTFEPQWGSDVFAMFQSLVDGREVPWGLLVKDMPPDRHQDLDFIVDQLDLEKNTDPHFKDRHFLPKVDASASDAHLDQWIVYGRIDGHQYFTAKELTVRPGASVTITDPGAHGLLCVQGHGTVNGQRLESPTLLRFGELSNDEYFAPEATATAGIHYVNASDREPLVILRYFGPEACADAPTIGART